MRAAIYARFSSDNQRSESIDAQIREITDYALKNNIGIVKVYTDEAKSAKTDDRPQFQKMIVDAESKLFDTILIHKFDRFSRNRYDSAIYKKKLRVLGIQIISIKEKLDDSPESVILESMLEGMAEYYSMNLAREVMKGLKENALKCKHTGGKPPFGYNVDSELYYIINEREAIAVSRIFENYATGKSYREILNWLNQGGYTTKYGKPFSQSALNAILKNEKYIGTYRYNMNKRIKKDGVTCDVRNPEDEIITIENGLPIIVDKDVFDKVQKQMAINKKNMRSSNSREQYLLSGLLYCGLCDSRMNGARRHFSRNDLLYVSYQCSKRKTQKSCTKKEENRDYLENAILRYLEESFFSDEFITEASQKMYAQYIESEKVKKDNTAVLNNELKQIEVKIENITDAIAAGMYHPSMKAKMDLFEKQKAETLRLLDEEKFKAKYDYTLEDIEAFFRQGKGITNKSFRNKKILINTFVSKIVVFENEIHLHLRISKDWRPGGKESVVTVDLCGSAPWSMVTSIKITGR